MKERKNKKWLWFKVKQLQSFHCPQREVPFPFAEHSERLCALTKTSCTAQHNTHLMWAFLKLQSHIQRAVGWTDSTMSVPLALISRYVSIQ